MKKFSNWDKAWPYFFIAPCLALNAGQNVLYILLAKGIIPPEHIAKLDTSSFLCLAFNISGLIAVITFGLLFLSQRSKEGGAE